MNDWWAQQVRSEDYTTKRVAENSLYRIWRIDKMSDKLKHTVFFNFYLNNLLKTHIAGGMHKLEISSRTADIQRLMLARLIAILGWFWGTRLWWLTYFRHSHSMLANSPTIEKWRDHSPHSLNFYCQSQGPCLPL